MVPPFIGFTGRNSAGKGEAIQYLVDVCKDYVNRQDKYGQTPVYYAAREGHISTIKLLIELGADIDHTDTKNQRPLYYAIQHDRFEMTKFLIDRGVNLNSGDKKLMIIQTIMYVIAGIFLLVGIYNIIRLQKLCFWLLLLKMEAGSQWDDE